MKNNNGKNIIRRVGLVNLVLVLILISTPAILAQQIKSGSIQNDLAGVWHLKQNIKESKRQSVNVFLPVIETPESLILVVEDGLEEITINEGFKKFINTQTLSTNGEIFVKNVHQIGKVTTRAYWENSRLVVEVSNFRGDRMKEIFELSPNKTQLYVTLQIAPFNSNKTHKIRRIYQKVAGITENNTEQVGITVYPF